MKHATASLPVVRRCTLPALLALIAFSFSTHASAGSPAARQTDQTSTPRSVGTTPCVGGPIATGASTVLIGGLPAARVGDRATSACGDNTISSGSSTVLIESLPAARVGDALNDGGAIVGPGTTTVLIGG